MSLEGTLVLDASQSEDLDTRSGALEFLWGACYEVRRVLACRVRVGCRYECRDFRRMTGG